MKIRLSIFVFFFSFFSSNFYAQVTIGACEAPENFSILEVISPPDLVGGLRLPLLSNTDRQALEDKIKSNTADVQLIAVGLSIYNTDNKSPEYWDGSKWVKMQSASTWLNASTGKPSIKVDDMIYHTGAVTIGDNSVLPTSAILNISSNNKGVLFPQVELVSTTSTEPISADPATVSRGLLVYNTGGNDNFPTAGFMFWDGGRWRLLSDAPTVKPELNGSLIANSAVLTPNSYKANQNYQGILEVGYTGGNGGSYSVGETYTDATTGLSFTLQPGKLESTGRLVYVVTGKPKVSSPTAIGTVPIKFLGATLGTMVIGGTPVISAVQYTLHRGQLISSGPAFGSKPVNLGYLGTKLTWRKDDDKEIKSITLPATGAYVFSFRLYGYTDGDKLKTESAAFYISALKQNGAAPSDRPIDTLLDVAEMTISKVNYLNVTYSINLTVSGQAGDKVYFKIARCDGFNFMWTLGNGSNDLDYATMANRTSMIYWKL